MGRQTRAGFVWGGGAIRVKLLAGCRAINNTTLYVPKYFRYLGGGADKGTLGITTIVMLMNLLLYETEYKLSFPPCTSNFTPYS